MLDLTFQEMFDKVKDHLLTQNKRSMIHSMIRSMKGTSCVYRDKLGNKCAIGALIPDEIYDKLISTYGEEINSKPIYILYDEQNILKIREEELSFLYELQKVHDNPLNWNQNGFNDMGISKLKDFAKYFKLHY